MCLKNLTPEEISEHIAWMRSSHGRGQEYQVVASRHLSQNSSIQGRWTTATFRPQVEARMARRAEKAAQQQQSTY